MDKEEPPNPKLVDELARMPYEPLDAVEKKLIVTSLVLGVGLLALLSWVSSAFFGVHH